MTRVRSYGIYNAKGVLVRTANDREVAQRYVEAMARLGSVFHVAKEVHKHKAA